MSSQEGATQVVSVLPLWDLAIPLPAVLMIVVGLYVALLGGVLWSRCCLKDRCGECDCLDCCSVCSGWLCWPGCSGCSDCSGCPDCSDCSVCIQWAQRCDCQPPSFRRFVERMCPVPSCQWCDCACTCQPPECESFNCLCFEIKLA